MFSIPGGAASLDQEISLLGGGCGHREPQCQPECGVGSLWNCFFSLGDCTFLGAWVSFTFELTNFSWKKKKQDNYLRVTIAAIKHGN